MFQNFQFSLCSAHEKENRDSGRRFELISSAVPTAGVPEVLDHVRRGEREENKVGVGPTASEAGRAAGDRFQNEILKKNCQQKLKSL